VHNQNLGKLGENIASEYLQNKGYLILETNFKANYGELDLITQENDTLVFVEVKTRIGNSFGEPEESILPHKMREVIKTAEFYMLKNNLSCDWRLDVIAICLRPDESLGEVEHFENVTL